MTQSITDVGEHPKGKGTIPERAIYTQNIVDMFRKSEPGRVVTYDEMAELIGMEVRPGSDGYRYVQSAIHIACRDHKIVMKNVQTVGYRHETASTVATSGMSELVGKIKRVVKRAKMEQLSLVDKMDKLTTEQRCKVAATSALLAFQNQILRPKKIDRLEAAAKASSAIGFKQTLKLFE
jgi:hypothetical protein